MGAYRPRIKPASPADSDHPLTNNLDTNIIPSPSPAFWLIPVDSNFEPAEFCGGKKNGPSKGPFLTTS
jgi:hypothetical protein